MGRCLRESGLGRGSRCQGPEAETCSRGHPDSGVLMGTSQKWACSDSLKDHLGSMWSGVETSKNHGREVPRLAWGGRTSDPGPSRMSIPPALHTTVASAPGAGTGAERVSPRVIFLSDHAPSHSKDRFHSPGF